jgi:hypothetical protein
MSAQRAPSDARRRETEPAALLRDGELDAGGVRARVEISVRATIAGNPLGLATSPPTIGDHDTLMAMHGR